MASIPNRRALRQLLPLLILGLGHAMISEAQTVDATRLDGLRDSVETEVRHVEAESLDANGPLLRQLSELRDEVGYLRARMRRGYPVEERECRNVELQLLALRGRVPLGVTRTPGRRPRTPLEIPVGGEIHARVREVTRDPSGSERFHAVSVADRLDGHALLPAGAVLTGSVTRLDPASRHDGRAGVAVMLRELTVDGRTYLVQLRILEWVVAGLDAVAVEFEGDGVVLSSEQALAAGAVLRVRVQSAIELTDNSR